VDIPAVGDAVARHERFATTDCPCQIDVCCFSLIFRVEVRRHAARGVKWARSDEKLDHRTGVELLQQQHFAAGCFSNNACLPAPLELHRSQHERQIDSQRDLAVEQHAIHQSQTRQRPR
jgi:hypothetical protein